MTLKINDYVGTLSKIDKLTSHTRLFTIDLDKEIDFKPGQFVNLSFEIDGELYRKPYSIASSPSEKNQIQLCINRVEGGRVTPKLFEKEEGDKVMIKGALGLFALKDKNKDKILFVCTGTGIAPLRSMIKALFEEQDNKNIKLVNGEDEENDEDEGVILTKEITLIYGVRSEEFIFLKKEFENYEKQYPNFKYNIVLSQPSDEWIGRRGYVQDNFEMVDPMNTEVYICGVPKMIESVQEKLLNIGMLQENIHFERFN